MTDLQFVDQHNMVAYMERTDRNAEFHQIVDFLTSSLIHYAFIVSPTIYASYIEQFWATAKSKTVNDVKQIHAKVDGKTVTHTPRRTKRGRDTEIPQSSGPPKNVGDEAFYTEEDDRVVRAATTAASLEAEQESGNINKTRSTETLNEPSPQGTGSGSGPRRHVTTLGDTDAQTSMEHQDDLMDFVSPTPHDSPLSGGYTPRSDEDLVIKKLRKKVKRLEKKQRARTPGVKRFKIGTSNKKTLDKENVSKKGRDESNKTEKLNLSDKGSGETEVLDYTTAAEKDVNAAEPISIIGDVVNVASVIPNVSAPGPSNSVVGDIFEDEMTTIADTLMAIRSTRPRTKSIVIYNVEEIAQSLFEEEQAQFEREQRIAREKAIEQEVKDAALIEQIEDVQAKMDADKERGSLLHKELNKLEISHQLELNSKQDGNLSETHEQINDFVSMDSEVVNDSEQQAESSKKRSRADHDKESFKKQKLEEDDAEKEEHRACLDSSSR
uniref:Xylulose kinase-1 n=1 Tax=Tanacetum cinerariifolium TaxID=118510 RepID=A0A699IAS6_TANCI|nr:hypothetical protein [Tanacetum cinerariifolium]